MFLLLHPKITSGLGHGFPIHNISWQPCGISAHVWPNLSGGILLKEACAHNSLKLAGVYIVIFSLNSHSWV